MVTVAELLRVLVLPLVVSTLIAVIGRWRLWSWAMPLAAGAGFLAGWAAYTGVPGLPPADGTDWLFWLAIPLTLLGILDARHGGDWGWLLGLAAGAVALGVAWPLIANGSVPAAGSILLCCGFGVVGAVMALVARIARPMLGSKSVGVALAATLGAAAVMVMSSNLRVVGIYGIAAASAMGPAAMLMPRKGRGVTVVASGLLAGLLAGGHFYPDPGVTLLNLTVLMLAPLLLLPAAFLPLRRTQARGAVGLAMVLIAIAAVTVPAAIAAKHAAEADPYGGSGY
ncbi:MAG TPA: hypothetical protein VF595_11575 [Tepidisphaeraceae bacterium]|jgi:hypothetical protein